MKRIIIIEDESQHQHDPTLEIILLGIISWAAISLGFLALPTSAVTG